MITLRRIAMVWCIAIPAVIGAAQIARASTHDKLVTAIKAQPDSPATIDSCAVRAYGNSVRFDVHVHAARSISKLRLSFGFYNLQPVLVGDIEVDGKATDRKIVDFRETDHPESYDRTVRYVRCSIATVRLAGQPEWIAPPDYRLEDWRGHPI
jgi:hypothetical protein